MISRRLFTAGAAMAVAAPVVLTSTQSRAQARVRRDVQALNSNDPIFAKYADAVKRMHELSNSDQRSWRNQALIHINHCKHGSPEFLHWHRHYLANFEAICGQLIGDSSFALPYWNWTGNRGRIPDPFYDVNFLNVEHWKDPSNAQSNNWGPDPVTTVGTRGLAKGLGLQDHPQRGGAFTKQAIDSIQNLTNYDVYVRRLEGSPHNSGHVVVGGNNGHMGDGVSPLDPIFWLHHCNVDRLWAQWQAAGNTSPTLSGDYSGNFVNAGGQPVLNATSANAINIASFGYTYDVLGGSAVENLSKQLNLQTFTNQTVITQQAVNTALRSIGKVDAAKTADMLVETRFSVSANNLVPTLFSPRAYWAPEVLGVQRLAIEPSRILARLSNVTGPKQTSPMVVNVFVNCPYLAPETPYDDKHYAGSFSFFGPSAHHPSEFLIDITDPLRKLAADGRLATSNIDVQLMPLPVAERAAKSQFSVGSIELLAA